MWNHENLRSRLPCIVEGGGSQSGSRDSHLKCLLSHPVASTTSYQTETRRQAPCRLGNLRPATSGALKDYTLVSLVQWRRWNLRLKSYKVSSVYRFTEVLESPSLTMSHIPAGWYQIHSASFPSSVVDLFEFQATGPIIGFSKKSPIATNQIVSSFPPSFQ